MIYEQGKTEDDLGVEHPLLRRVGSAGEDGRQAVFFCMALKMPAVVVRALRKPVSALCCKRSLTKRSNTSRWMVDEAFLSYVTSRCTSSLHHSSSLCSESPRRIYLLILAAVTGRLFAECSSKCNASALALMSFRAVLKFRSFWPKTISESILLKGTSQTRRCNSSWSTWLTSTVG